MIKTYSGFKGFMAFLGLGAGLVLLILVVFLGIKEVVAFVLPLLGLVSYVLIAVFLLLILPLSLVKKWRSQLVRSLVIMSKVLGAAAWMMSYLFVITSLGILGAFFCFLLQFLIPVALIEAALKGSWPAVLKIIVWVSFMYAMKFYAHWLRALESNPTIRGKVIDVEIER